MRTTILLILTLTGSLMAVTRNISVTVADRFIPALLYYVALQDDDPATVDETDVTGAIALAWLQGEVDALVKDILRTAVRTAIQDGRTDLLPAPVVAAQDAKETAESTLDQELEAVGGAAGVP